MGSVPTWISYRSASLIPEIRQRVTLSIQIGTNPPYTLSFMRDMGKVVGLWFEFSGYGSIDEIALKDGNGRVIYEEMF